YVSGGREVDVLFRIVAELGAMAELAGLRQAVHVGPDLGHGDDARQIVRVAVDGNATSQRGERHAFGLQVAVVDANERGELSAGRVPTDDDLLRIAAVLADVLVNPAERSGDVADQLAHVNVRIETIVRADENETAIDKE